MKNIIIIIAAIFTINVTAQESEFIMSENQTWFAGQGENKRIIAERNNKCTLEFDFEGKSIVLYDSGTDFAIVTVINSVEKIREDIYEYRGVDQAGTPTVIQTYCDKFDNIIDVRVYFWNLQGPGEADDVFMCISHEITK